MGKEWHSPIIKNFLKNIGFDNPEKAIIHCAYQLLENLNPKEPPIDIYEVAKYQKITVKEITGMSDAGRLIPVKDGFVLEIRSSDPLKRKRFTCAHEIAHSFFHQPNNSSHWSAQGFNAIYRDREVERLCDLGASELLMPTNLFTPKLKELGISIDTLLSLSNHFETSLKATAIKMVSESKQCVIIFWCYIPKPGGPEEALRVNWFSAPKGIFIPLYARPDSPRRPVLNTILEAFHTQKKIEGIEKIKLGNLAGYYPIQAMRLNKSNYVLSIIDLKKGG